MKKKVDVLILIEHVDRELDIAVILKILLWKNWGISSEIASNSYDYSGTLERFKPKVAVVPYFIGLYKIYRELNNQFPDCKFVNLGYEQISHSLNRDWRGVKDDFARESVKHCVWGDEGKRFLIEHGVTSRISVTGNPVYELYLSPFCEAHKEKKELAEQYGLDATKNWALYAENYKTVFLKQGKFNSFVTMGASKEQVEAYFEYERSAFTVVAQWFYEAALEQPDMEFIVRPRPANPFAPFLEKIKKALAVDSLPDNIKVIRGETAREWILASDTVCSSYSTTLIEAAIAQKKIFSLVPSEIPEFLYHPWLDYITQVRNKEDLLNAVSDPEKGDFSNLRRWAFDTMIPTGSIRRQAGVIGDVLGVTALTIQNDVETIEMSDYQPEDSRYLWWREKDKFDMNLVNQLIKTWSKVIRPQKIGHKVNPDISQSDFTSSARHRS